MVILKIGIIGCGTIGQEIAKACQDGRVDLAAISDVDTEKAESLNNFLKKKAEILTIDELIKKMRSRHRGHQRKNIRPDIGKMHK